MFVGAVCITPFVLSNLRTVRWSTELRGKMLLMSLFTEPLVIFDNFISFSIMVKSVYVSSKHKYNIGQ